MTMGESGDFDGHTLWYCQNSYWTSPFVLDLPNENRDVPSRYVQLLDSSYENDRIQHRLKPVGAG